MSFRGEVDLEDCLVGVRGRKLLDLRIDRTLLAGVLLLRVVRMFAERDLVDYSLLYVFVHANGTKRLYRGRNISEKNSSSYFFLLIC